MPADSSKRRPFRFDDFLRQRRASQPRIAPAGDVAVFTAVRPDREHNRNHSDLYRVATTGGEVRQLTHQGSSNRNPALSPDGRYLAFTSNRSGKSQVWLLPMGGGEARQVTRFDEGARLPVWSPDGSRLLVVSPVRVAGTADRSQEAEAGTASAASSSPQPRIADDLMFRHWDSWTEGKVEHLFMVDVASGDAVDLTPGPYPVPPRALTGDPDYAFSPDGAEVCFVSLRDPEQARSTNTNLWTIPVSGGDSHEPKRVSPWPGVNAFPTYAPDGGAIAYCGMRRAGYEANRMELLVYERATGQLREVAPGFNHSVGAPVWSPDGEFLCFAAEDKGTTRLFRVLAAGGKPEPVTGGAVDRELVISADGSWLGFVRQTSVSPPELWRVAADGGDAQPLTALNRDALAELELHAAEDFWYEGAGGQRVHGFLYKPPGFAEDKRYPVVFLIHGRPQGAFSLDFHERWNPQLFAAQGYVVVTLNPRGSTGYGQAFTDAIHGQWGGACYEDLTRGFDHVLASFPFVDPERTAVAGASFGGFMINWIAGHTDRFRCLVSHDGIFNTEMMDYATDELWFTEWEFDGAPWESEEAYRKWSPHRHVGNMSTPMLVVQGEQDFRCPVSESLDLFTALRRRGVRARLVYFPDEGHWVLKPSNREVWWREVLGWLAEHLA